MAVNDYVKIQRTVSDATEAAELLNFIRTLRQAYEIGSRIRAKMRHNFSDSGGTNTIDWSTVQILYGIPAGATNIGPTAIGSVVFTLIDGSIGAMEGTFQNTASKDITEKVG